MAEKEEQKIKEVRASIGDLHISPRKVRLVTDLIKSKSVEEARRQLQFLNKKAARPILKLLNSAVANAKHNFQLNLEELLIKNITVNQGRTSKRFMPRAQGRAFPIRHRAARVEITLVGGYKPKGGARAKVRKVKSPVLAAEAAEKPAQKSQAPAERPQPKWKAPGSRGGKIRQTFVAMKRRLFNRKTNA